jgi:arylsulfatase
MPNPSRPNILLVTTDHWSSGLLGQAGHPDILTPTLDQLALGGVRYTNAYSECPVCIPARRTLMTGTPPRTHGDRVFKTHEPMPDLPNLAGTFCQAGYQAYAVGKLHVMPQRDRIGFNDVILAEEGRPVLGAVDDYDLFLADNGHPGQGYAHGMSNNEYHYRPWHLEERLHVTNWATQQMARQIKRRDPTKPGFWFLSYCHPHPPLVPLQCYLDLYRDCDIAAPYSGDWAEDDESLPYALRARRRDSSWMDPRHIRAARLAFYAMCTHIDHQLRLIIGTLREEGLLDNTAILFTSDHGDMLGNHGLWAKRLFYEDSANVPMILSGPGSEGRVGHHRTDNRLVGWQDVMPTLLDLAGIEPPDTVEGLSMVGTTRRDALYGECGEGATATRMLHDGRHKLVYYPVGNRLQLFDLERDPRETNDVAGTAAYANILEQLEKQLISQLYGGDENWVEDGHLRGLPDQKDQPTANRGLNGQRGVHYPLPPQDAPGAVMQSP